ncbi:hypothetical protein Tco_0799690 [Tanacetum coccineum]|uniref:Reverse transcriptase domain-containing protein n=1 Tax=Tanacetum coccineum TaxID=301880 RepID=A0ABQ4ZUA6_9ASTR
MRVATIEMNGLGYGSSGLYSILQDVSVESVGSSFSRVILIGSISVEVPVAPKEGAVIVASPARVLELDTYSLSKADPSESSPPLVCIAPMVSPFLCLDDLESDTEIPERHVSPTPHDAMLTRWRSRVASIITPLLLSRDPYCSHFTRTICYLRPCRALTVRKSVRRLPSHYLALRYTSHHLDHFTSGSSSSHSSSDHSSSGHSISGLHGVARPISIGGLPPLSTMSPAAIVTLCIHDTRALVPSRADLLPPRKRFRDSISPEDSVEEDIDTDVLEDIEANVMAVKVAIDRDVEAEIDACIGMEVDVGVDVEDEVESSDRGTMEVGVDVVARIDKIPMLCSARCLRATAQRQLEVGQLEASRERAGLDDRVRSLGWENLRVRALLCIERDHVDSLRRHMALSQEEFRQVHRDRDDTRRRLWRTMTITRSGMTPEAIEELVNRRVEEALAAYEATRAAKLSRLKAKAKTVVTEIMEMVEMEMVEMEIQMRMIEGTERVVGLIRWFEKMETVFHISNYLKKYQVKYATCTLLNSALTWWNSHKRTIGSDAAFSMLWRELMKLIAKVYCPRTKTQKMESEL